MKNTKHLLFDSDGAKAIQRNSIPNYYNAFDKLDLFDLKDVIFKVHGENLLDHNFRNSSQDTLWDIRKSGLKTSFVKLGSPEIEARLRLVESKMPEILSFITYYSHIMDLNSFEDFVLELTRLNPLQFDLSQGHPFYEYKLKKLLFSLSLTDWINQSNNFTNGISYINKNGELICCHVVNETGFEKFLMENTTVIQKKYLNNLFEENGELFIKLNLQIRFK
jgi:hypothetical protein